jgi:hypothetical protein
VSTGEEKVAEVLKDEPVTEAATTGTHRYLGNHAAEINVGDTRLFVEPGEFVTLDSADEDEEGNKAMIDEGVLVALGDLSKEGG